MHAARILEATVKAVDLPVTLKMRTGWDDSSRNAPTLARIAEACGIRMITVHGRTRCQFYAGSADWAFIRAGQGGGRRSRSSSTATSLTLEDAAGRCAESGADGVMIGRGCYGRPWFIAQVDRLLRHRRRLPDPPLAAAIRDRAASTTTTC